jgi:hypothetical protein
MRSIVLERVSSRTSARGAEPPRLNSLRNCRDCETNPSALRRFFRSFQGPLSQTHSHYRVASHRWDLRGATKHLYK